MDAVEIGEAVEARYKALGLTQESLAWLAGVSNTTVRNVLRGRVGAARTWPRFARALGWEENGSLEALQQGSEPREVIAVPALKSLYAAILRSAEDDEQEARQALTDYENFVQKVELMGTPFANERSVRPIIAKLWPLAVSRLSPAEAEPLKEAFLDYGWQPHVVEESLLKLPKRPYVDPDTDEAIAAVKARRQGTEQERKEQGEAGLAAVRDLVQRLNPILEDRAGVLAFRRLPVRVQSALEDGEVLDTDIVPLPNGMSMVTMILRDRVTTKPLTVHDRAVLMNAFRVWHEALASSTAALERSTAGEED